MKKNRYWSDNLELVSIIEEKDLIPGGKPIPSPIDNEDQDTFVSRCMADPVMVDEYPDEKQRYAICVSKVEKSKGGDGSGNFDHAGRPGEVGGSGGGISCSKFDKNNPGNISEEYKRWLNDSKEIEKNNPDNKDLINASKDSVGIMNSAYNRLEMTPDAEMIVAKDVDGKIQGISQYEYYGEGAQISYFATAPENLAGVSGARRGVGSEMLNSTFKEVIASGKSECILTSSTRAQQFYKNAGFKSVGGFQYRMDRDGMKDYVNKFSSAHKSVESDKEWLRILFDSEEMGCIARIDEEDKKKGSESSGNFGHEGRPGAVGGSGGDGIEIEHSSSSNIYRCYYQNSEGNRGNVSMVLDNNNKEGLINDLNVDKEIQGKGIATRMVMKLADQAPKSYSVRLGNQTSQGKLFARSLVDKGFAYEKDDKIFINREDNKSDKSKEGDPIMPNKEEVKKESDSEFAKLFSSDGMLKYCVGSIFTKDKILDLKDYDPSLCEAMQLKEDFRTCGYWYYSVKSGRKITVKSCETIVELNKEMIENTMEKIMRTQCSKGLIVYFPSSMKPDSKELFTTIKERLVSRGVKVPIRN